MHVQKYVQLIVFPQQQWFRERASVLRYTYVACIVSTLFNSAQAENSTASKFSSVCFAHEYAEKEAGSEQTKHVCAPNKHEETRIRNINLLYAHLLEDEHKFYGFF